MSIDAKRQYELNKELAQMLKGGVIMDVTTPEQAKIAEAAGACAVMALERIPADIRAAGGVSKMIAELSEDLGEAMIGINEDEIQLLMAERGK